MSRLLIAGAGGHGKVVAETALAMKQWDKVVFVDDRHPVLESVLGLPVVGPLSGGVELRSCFDAVAVAVGDSAFRLELLDLFAGAGFSLPVLVHPTAWVGPSVTLGEGCVVFAQAVINADSRLGRGIIVNTGATVDHDCVVKDGAHVCPGAHLAGGVQVGRMSWIGIGSAVIQNVRVGDGATVGAGAVVTGDVAPASVVVGVPARPVMQERE